MGKLIVGSLIFVGVGMVVMGMVGFFKQVPGSRELISGGVGLLVLTAIGYSMTR